jgi:hypothetical protein
MAIISSTAMIRSLSLFHMTLAAVLLRSPQIIAKQSMVMILGQSMQLVRLLSLSFQFLNTAELVVSN